VAQSRCARCGVEDKEVHKIAPVGWGGTLTRYRHADGAFISSESVDMCGRCLDELVGMLGSTERRYPDAVPGR
jgi:hypothetical protein